MMIRLEANRKILELLKEAVETWPDWRFHQILQNLNIEETGVDKWYEESEETLRNMGKREAKGELQI